MSVSLVEIRAKVSKAIRKKGIDTVKMTAVPLLQMVLGSKIKREKLGLLVASGFERINPIKLEMTVQCIADALPPGKERDRVESDLAYWREHRDEVLEDNGVPKVTP